MRRPTSDTENQNSRAATTKKKTVTTRLKYSAFTETHLRCILHPTSLLPISEAMSDTDESLVIVENVYSSSMVEDDDTDEPELIEEEKDPKRPSKTDAAVELNFKPTSSATESTATKPIGDEKQGPHAIQIVSIGTEDDPYAFVYNTAAVQTILDQIPSVYKHTEISIVSVVGAFRTGKSFLLSWFIHYLQHLQQSQTLDSNADLLENLPWFTQMNTIGNDGFHWQAGADRNTTGIWMWSQPFIIRDPMSPQTDTTTTTTTHNATQKHKVVLLMDTQGMYDHETTMTLTTNIFGFSTLLSSYQIYNVDKRIQEDHLQSLALFSEYARLMTTTTTSADEDTKEEKEDGTNDDSDIRTADMTPDASSDPSSSNKSIKEATTITTTTPKPFQKIEFLVRDWQHFDDINDDDDDDDNANLQFDVIADSMMNYLHKVLAERDAKDLQDTREQILSCFDTISCFGLCHPGIAVTKKKFTGNIKDIDPMFIKLVSKYCETIFHPNNLPSKTIHGRTITADQFGVYMQAYAKIFTESLSSSSSSSYTTGKVNFPTATTMLEATATANNTNALRMAFMNYKNSMDRVAGPNVTNYISHDEFKSEHELHVQHSYRVFDSIANFGSNKSILATRQQLIQDLSSSYETYKTMNDGRNPLAGVEMYVSYQNMEQLLSIR